MGSEIETFKQFPKGNDEKNGSREGNRPNEGGTERQSGLRQADGSEATRHFPSLRLPLLFFNRFRVRLRSLRSNKTKPVS
ncbi:MAG: hypothetical protein ACTS4Z_00990 [Candidatus Hodgkinia cicadicola]